MTSPTGQADGRRNCGYFRGSTSWNHARSGHTFSAEPLNKKKKKGTQSQLARRMPLAAFLLSILICRLSSPAPNSWSHIEGVITKMTPPREALMPWITTRTAATTARPWRSQLQTRSLPEDAMGDQVIATARLTATCRRELREQLRLSVDPASELSRLNSIVGSRRLTLPELQQLISTPSARSVLSTLASVEFSRVRAHMEGGSRSALETTATDLQAELAETVAAAITVVTTATRDITAYTIAKCGLELGYTVASHRAENATRVELRRRHQTVMVRVHDGGNVEFGHAGLTDGIRLEHQLQLERSAGCHGVLITERP